MVRTISPPSTSCNNTATLSPSDVTVQPSPSTHGPDQPASVPRATVAATSRRRPWWRWHGQPPNRLPSRFAHRRPSARRLTPHANRG